MGMVLPSGAESGISEFELVETARYQLRTLTDSLLRLGSQLDINDAPVGRWASIIRTLRLIEGLSSRNLVAVAGEQGAGKTHLLSNLYPEAAGWLEGNIGRGEKTAVAVQEHADCTEPRGFVVRRRRWDRNGRKTDSQPGEGLTYEVAYTFDKREEWRAAVTAESPDVLLVRLEVPLGFLGADSWGFALLPGFERVRDKEWQNLMKVVLATSPAALVVVDGGGLADETQAEILEHLQRAGGQAIEFVVAVSRCEELRSPGLLAQRVNRAMEVFGAREPDVIPVGRTRDDPANWPDQLRAALEHIRGTSARSHQLEAAMLHQVIRDDVRDVIHLAGAALDSSALRTDIATEIDEYMSVFDRACERLRKELSTRVDKEFGSHYQAAHDRLGEALKGIAWKDLALRPVDWARLRSHKGWIERLNTVVDKAWDPDEAQRIQRAVTDAVTEVMWRAYGQEFLASLTQPGQEGTGLALLSGDPRDETPHDSADGRSKLLAASAPHALPGTAELSRKGIGTTLRVLPGAALQARAFALRLADPGGEIPAAPDDRTLNEAVRDLAGAQRQLLLALSVVVGDTELAKELDKQAKESGKQAVGPSEMLANLTDIASNTKKFRPVVHRLLGAKAGAKAVAAAKPAATAIAKSTMGTATAATGAATTAATGAATTAATGAATTAATATATAAAGEAATGAAVVGLALSPALAAALTAAGVAAAGAMVIQAGNRAARKRDGLADARLAEWRAITQVSILTNTDDLLRTTREIVERRLCVALGADEDLNRRFRLRQAIEDVRRDRALMLETLRDDHLG
jgi:hypothetical protein